MRGDKLSVEEALGRRCIADTSLLNNFVHSASVYILDRLLREPVHLSPTVLNVEETLLSDFPRMESASEFLKPLYMAGLPGHSDYRKIAPIQSFALSAGDLWEPAEPSRDELVLAARLSSRTIRDEVRRLCPNMSRTRVELDPGEAEAAAIAISRGWHRSSGNLFTHLPVETVRKGGASNALTVDLGRIRRPKWAEKCRFGGP